MHGCLFSLVRRQGCSQRSTQQAFVSLSKVSEEIQVIISQDQGAGSPNISVKAMSAGHNLAVDARQLDQIATVFSPARLLQIVGQGARRIQALAPPPLRPSFFLTSRVRCTNSSHRKPRTAAVSLRQKARRIVPSSVMTWVALRIV
jgi:hypothetical protein